MTVCRWCYDAVVALRMKLASLKLLPCLRKQVIVWG